GLSRANRSGKRLTARSITAGRGRRAREAATRPVGALIRGQLRRRRLGCGSRRGRGGAGSRRRGGGRTRRLGGGRTRRLGGGRTRRRGGTDTSRWGRRRTSGRGGSGPGLRP